MVRRGENMNYMNYCRTCYRNYGMYEIHYCNPPITGYGYSGGTTQSQYQYNYQYEFIKTEGDYSYVFDKVSGKVVKQLIKEAKK